MNGDRPAGDLRTHGQRRATPWSNSPAARCAPATLPDGARRRRPVRVTIDWFALCAARGAPGVAGGDCPSPARSAAETARRLACDAGVIAHASPTPTGCRWTSAATSAPPPPRSAGPRAPRRALRLRRLHRPGRLVRRPPRPALGPRRPHLVRERRPALRTAPHRRPRRRLHASPATPAPPPGTPTAPTAARSTSGPPPPAPAPPQTSSTALTPRAPAGRQPAGAPGCDQDRSGVVGHRPGELQHLLLGERRREPGGRRSSRPRTAPAGTRAVRRGSRVAQHQLRRPSVDGHVELRSDRPHDRCRTWSAGMTSSGNGMCTFIVCCS